MAPPYDLASWGAVFWADHPGSGAVDNQTVPATWPNPATAFTTGGSWPRINTPVWKANWQNGRSVVEFQNGDSFAGDAAGNPTPGVQFSSAGLVAKTVVIIGATPATDSDLCDGYGVVDRMLVDRSGSTWRMFAGSLITTGNIANGDPHLFVAAFNSAGASLTVDGTVVIASGNSGSYGTNRASIGQGQPAQGSSDLSQVAFFGVKAGALTAQELNDIKQWAADYYGLTIEGVGPTAPVLTAQDLGHSHLIRYDKPVLLGTDLSHSNTKDQSLVRPHVVISSLDLLHGTTIDSGAVVNYVIVLSGGDLIHGNSKDLSSVQPYVVLRGQDSAHGNEKDLGAVGLHVIALGQDLMFSNTKDLGTVSLIKPVLTGFDLQHQNQKDSGFISTGAVFIQTQDLEHANTKDVSSISVATPTLVGEDLSFSNSKDAATISVGAISLISQELEHANTKDSGLIITRPVLRGQALRHFSSIDLGSINAIQTFTSLILGNNPGFENVIPNSTRIVTVRSDDSELSSVSVGDNSVPGSYLVSPAYSTHPNIGEVVEVYFENEG